MVFYKRVFHYFHEALYCFLYGYLFNAGNFCNFVYNVCFCHYDIFFKVKTLYNLNLYVLGV